ncbi:RNA-binding S4 domain-containing protein [Chitinivorax sp. B]|uniref:RNA-binding S4 domain-containing protein n=1 Tax=Chitinivorax sp. B TaxID=2502235 RepID=UPI001485258B|nr:RNA-binding S4 domain-containing protein [Chitinivorax sp. B]
MPEIEFELRDEFVELHQLLKLTGLADSGGMGKMLVSNGEVTVDGQPESRKTAKIRANQVVECLGTRIIVRNSNQ